MPYWGEEMDARWSEPPADVQVKILDEHGNQVGEASMMTEHEVGVLYETIPHNWTIEEV